MRFVHFLEETVLRFGPYPNMMGTDFATGLAIPDPRSKRVQAALAAVDRETLKRGSFLVKYGKRQFLEDTLNQGVVRISPASTFSDSSLNGAIRDTELEFSIRLYKPTTKDIQPYLAPNEKEFKFDGTAIFTETANEDFYLYCLSASYEPRIFDDFDADSCLLIRNPTEFIDRLMWGVYESVQARGYAFVAVDYVDPMTETGKGIHISCKKDARYAYQDEMRGIWLPKYHSNQLQVQLVEIGNLSDIAELITL